MSTPTSISIPKLQADVGGQVIGPDDTDRPADGALPGEGDSGAVGYSVIASLTFMTKC